MKDCLFLDDAATDDGYSELPDHRNWLMKRIEDRSSNLHFIAKQLTYAAEESDPGERKPEDDSTSMNRILAINNQLSTAKDTSDRDRYKLILDDIGHYRSSVVKEVDRHINASSSPSHSKKRKVKRLDSNKPKTYRFMKV